MAIETNDGNGLQDNVITCTAPINIAIIKYWGKKCQKLNLPLNSSFSVTLHQDQLKSTTTVTASSESERDEVWLNGKQQDVEKNERIKVCLIEMRRLARKRAIKDDSNITTLNKFSKKLKIISSNDFPTAAGLASSASGYAALVYSIARLYNIDGDISTIARRGSGSACRSIYGGFVEWVMGNDAEGSDSKAVQYLTEDHWPELRVLILVVSQDRKSIGSTAAMQRSVDTSPLLHHRASDIVAHRLKAIKDATLNRDFCSFAEICMKESNQLHAVCRDTYPPVNYLNETSKSIIDFVHAYNAHSRSVKLAYTFDAGPNAFLFTVDAHLPEVSALIERHFAPKSGGNFFRGLNVGELPAGDLPDLSDVTFKGKIEYAICTKAGPGPQIVKN